MGAASHGRRRWWLVAALALASCETTARDVGSALIPGYFELTYGQGDAVRVAPGNDTTYLMGTLGWYIKPVPTTPADPVVRENDNAVAETLARHIPAIGSDLKRIRGGVDAVETQWKTLFGGASVVSVILALLLGRKHLPGGKKETPAKEDE